MKNTLKAALLALCATILFGCDLSGLIPPAKSSEKAFTSFGLVSPAVTGTVSGTAISIAVPSGTPLSSLVAVFSVSSGATVTVGGVAQVSGVTSNDFSTPQNYRVTAEDGTSKVYVVTVTPAAAPGGSSEKAITSFGLVLPEVDGAISGSAISVEVPFGTSPSALVAVFTVSAGASVTVGGVAQTSGVTGNDFSSPLSYKVTAEDGSWQVYIVTITSGAAPFIGDWGISIPDTLIDSDTGESVATTLEASFSIKADGTWVDDGFYSPPVPGNTYLSSGGTWTATATTFVMVMSYPSSDTQVLDWELSGGGDTLTMTLGGYTRVFTRK
jgi:hypothetical protein